MQAQQFSALLVERGLLSESQANSSLQLAKTQQIPFITLLIRQHTLNTHKLAELIAEVFACPLLDLDALAPQAADLNTFNPLTAQNQSRMPARPKLDDETTDCHRLWLEHRVIPLAQRGSVLQLAMADPASLGALGGNKSLGNLLLQPVIVDAEKLERCLKQMFHQKPATQTNFIGTSPTVELVMLNDDIADEDPAGTDLNQDSDKDLADEGPVVRYVNQVLLEAVRLRASDIHIEPFESWCRIRYRIDGILRESARSPAKFAARLSSRLKVMAALDITERRRPQDGRIRLRLADTNAVDLRISTLPTLWGEKIVLRILDSGNLLLTLDELGCLPEQHQLYLQSLDSHQGMILVTGPTGSGKTVTLYSGLAHLNAGERNIATAEDPVEINLEGINQVAVNRRSGLDFATALRAFLRQDPDVVMVGEIRDQETADIAVKAAQTGHLVLSTLHTNSAAETVMRLLNMGIEAYNLASALSLIISQRLLRRLCVHCSLWAETQAHEASVWPSGQAPARIRHANGCQQCQDGYKGRLALMEMLPITAEIRQLICHHCEVSELQRAALASGWITLQQSALAKVVTGETSLQEVQRVLS